MWTCRRSSECLAAIPRLAVNAFSDNALHCFAATSCIAVDGQPLALEGHVGHVAPRPEMMMVAMARLSQSYNRMMTPPSDSALHAPLWISLHVSYDKRTREVAAKLAAALSVPRPIG
jgi:hypothetical protein